MAILDKKAEMEGVSLPEDVRNYIATKTKSNVRELEGAMIKLVAYSSVTGTAINLAMAQQVLKYLIPGGERRVNMDTVLRAVAEKFQLQPAQLKQWWGPESVVCVDAQIDLRVGGRYRIANRLLKHYITGSGALRNSTIADLSDRELEVFRLIGEGHGTRQIAEELHVSVKTVESYQAHIKEKLSLRSARELMQHAIQWNMNEKTG